MAQIQVACGALTWFARPGRQLAPEERPSVELVMEEIARAGYEGIPIGGKALDEVPAYFRLIASKGLKPAPGYYGAPFHEAGRRAEFVAAAAALAKQSAAMGLKQLYVAGNVFPERRAVAGHVVASRGIALSPEQFRAMADVLNAVGEACLQEGVQACFHNHAGSYVETEEEFERLVELTDPGLVFLGPDTGHLCWGGGDNVAFFRRHADRVRSVHLKDINPTVLEQGRREKVDYGTFSARGIFAELGEGCVDTPGIFEALRAVGFSGWVVVETDVTTKASPFESARISREYLRRVIGV